MQKPYLPEIIPENDLAMFRKGRMGGRVMPASAPAILVVDMTRGFVEDEFPMGCSSTGLPAAIAIREVLDVARPLHVPVFFTRGFPGGGLLEDGAWEDKRVSLKPGTLDPMITEEAHTIVSVLTPVPGEVVITKAKPSAFFGTQLISMLVYKKIDTLIVTGMVTSGCVRATVVDAFSYNFKVLVPIECVADRGRVSHEVALFDMDQKYANICAKQEVVDYLRKSVK
ncbi:isochorismatase family protein [Paradesulfitobacterium aromaticivorans]